MLPLEHERRAVHGVVDVAPQLLVVKPDGADHVVGRPQGVTAHHAVLGGRVVDGPVPALQRVARDGRAKADQHVARHADFVARRVHPAVEGDLLRVHAVAAPIIAAASDVPVAIGRDRPPNRPAADLVRRRVRGRGIAVDDDVVVQDGMEDPLAFPVAGAVERDIARSGERAGVVQGVSGVQLAALHHHAAGEVVGAVVEQERRAVRDFERAAARDPRVVGLSA